MLARSIGAVMLTAACLAALLAGTPMAHADRFAAKGGADTITASGPCAAGSSWVMGARAQRRGIAVLVRVKSGPGQRWRIVLRHNGAPVRTAVRRTGWKGAATLVGRTANLPGVDTYSFVARHRPGQQTCTGALAY
jgi:hypothetical protein